MSKEYHQCESYGFDGDVRCTKEATIKRNGKWRCKNCDLNDRPRCSQKVYHRCRKPFWGVCSNFAVVKRGERWFCKFHDPVLVTERNAKKEQADKEKMEQETDLLARTAILLKMAEGIETEDLEDAKIVVKKYVWTNA